ncbi:uncharacterized protein LOC131079901 [Cryptomeria japonica]|uniref:uncharacterized protein LOC131079901 n=1 Tax=Cryptomeria japonica TaxID=3369 RepID=UPI0027DA3BA0|nr:uncharacterized protein LOC131079901 [Cryptomeria japonica]
MLENKRLSASPGIGKRKLEGGESTKEKASSSKKSKSAFRTEAHEEKKDTEETGKDGSEMDTDDSEGEDSWKDEDVGVEDEEGENESDNDSPIHSASPGNDNSQPMVDVKDKGNEKKDVNSEREKNKEPKKDTTKDSLSEDKESRERSPLEDNETVKNVATKDDKKDGVCVAVEIRVSEDPIFDENFDENEKDLLLREEIRKIERLFGGAMIAETEKVIKKIWMEEDNS